jgi:hypothetical protein
MTTKFEQLSQALNENISFQLNGRGRALLQSFYELVGNLEKSVIPVIKPYVTDIEKLKKEIALQIISTVNSQKIGTAEFEIATRLDTLTSGGKTPIDGNRFVFNKNDKILQYVDRMS